MQQNHAPQSSGWEHYSDPELARWYKNELEGEVAEPSPFTPDAARWEELKTRGIIIKECSECSYRTMHHQHDYVCILCRLEM